MTKRRLGELLQAEGLVSEEQVRQGLEDQRKSYLFLGEALVKLGFVSEEIIAQTIVQQFSLPFMSAQQYQITPQVINLFPERMYYEYQFVAADRIGKVLIIIGAGLMNHDVLDELERLSGCKVCQFVSTWKDIRAALDKYAKDIKKEQSSLTSLGTMLLDLSDVPMNTPASAPAPSGVPTPLAGAASVARPAAQPPPAGQPAPRPTMAGTSGPRTAIGAVMTPRPGSTTGPQSPRLSALAGVRPPPLRPTANGSGVQAAPPAPAQPTTQEIKTNLTGTPPPDPNRPPVPAPKNTGLLGLFKKS